jgi:hypothetical protein
MLILGGRRSVNYNLEKYHFNFEYELIRVADKFIAISPSPDKPYDTLQRIFYSFEFTNQQKSSPYYDYFK